GLGDRENECGGAGLGAWGALMSPTAAGRLRLHLPGLLNAGAVSLSDGYIKRRLAEAITYATGRGPEPGVTTAAATAAAIGTTSRSRAVSAWTATPPGAPVVATHDGSELRASGAAAIQGGVVEEDADGADGIDEGRTTKLHLLAAMINRQKAGKTLPMPSRRVSSKGSTATTATTAASAGVATAATAAA
ncbi:unnamed protein product, partial [Phaeothamnion confervicola]